MRTYTTLLRSNVGVLCALLACACQGNVVAPSGGPPSGGASSSSVGGSSVGGSSAITDPNGALPADDIRSVSQECDPLAPASAEFAPLARLTRREYVRTLKDLLGVDFPLANLQPDGIVGLFFANVASPVSETQVDEYRLVAEQLAEAASVDAA